METKVRYQQKGDLIISDNAISTIVRLASTEIEGVTQIKHNIAEDVAGFFKKNSYYKGVKVDSNETGLALDVNIKVKYGYNVSTVALEVQENIKTALETMLDIKVSEINIHVIGIEINE